MNVEAAEKRVWTAEEYLAWERAQSEKHAFYKGQVFALAGANREHNLLVGNIDPRLRAGAPGPRARRALRPPVGRLLGLPRAARRRAAGARLHRLCARDR